MTTTPMEAAPAAPFTIGSRSQSRLVSTQVVTAAAGGSFNPIQVSASGWIEAIEIEVDVDVVGTGLAIATGDSPWNYLSRITLTDSQGRPVIAPISGYDLYLKNKYLDSGFVFRRDVPNDPRMSSGFAHAVAGGTAGTTRFRLWLVGSQDWRGKYGLWPNLDSNANMQLRIDFAAATTINTGTVTTISSSLRVTQHFWAPAVDSSTGMPINMEPMGAGDFVETRFEAPTVNASAENLTQVLARGGQIKGIILVSRTPAGVRTAFTPNSQFGLILDNVPIIEGVRLESWQDRMRRFTGYSGLDSLPAAGYPPLATLGVNSGLDVGVLVLPFHQINEYRDGWLGTRGGSFLQVRHTPGANATVLNIITDICQTDDASAFYART